MLAPKTLRKPSNWQDFESLCKELWGEIWNAPEIQKNGRLGQSQHGIDISAIPFGEIQYYGIQCKGKDEYTDKQFTEEEVIKGIEVAKKFKPQLKKLYFATTAVKDAKIEEFVRQKNVENIAKTLFEVHLFSWEDIVDLIDRNKRTHDWYLKSQNFKVSQSVSVTFQNGLTTIDIEPVFKQVIHKQFYVANMREYLTQNPPHQQDNFYKHALPYHEIKTNLSYSPFQFVIKNSGESPIEEFKLFFTIENDIDGISRSNELHYGMADLSLIHCDVEIYPDSFSGKIDPRQKILVSEDSYESYTVFIKPKLDQNHITVRWKLTSINFKDEGELTINSNPKIKEEIINYPEANPEKAKTVKDPIEDLIV